MEAAMITPQDALFQTRAFRAQRNAYMTGVALLLMGLLNRVYKYITAALQAEAEVSILKTQLRDVTAQLSVALSGKAEIQNKYDMVRREILSEDTVREVPSTQ
ncbi:hypothetical protein Pelo_9369 [Pelomyxa schiedti]|nr:hypothetical protein Pelo_9369 [Pelomyxa schiedti]